MLVSLGENAISIVLSNLLPQMSLFCHINYLLLLIQNKTSATIIITVLLKHCYQSTCCYLSVDFS